jgi:hypothetical protein
MIFGAKNEKNESTCDLVLAERKICTRRLETGRVYKVGHDYAVQRHRGAKSEGTIKIIGAVKHLDWVHKSLTGKSADDINRILQRESENEGFYGWKGLLDYMTKNNIDINNTIRYKFKLMGCGKCQMEIDDGF